MGLRILVGFWAAVLMHGAAEGLAHVDEVVHGEVAVPVVSFRRPAERTLQRVRVRYVELFEHHHSPRRFLRLVGPEHAPMEAEVLAVLVKQPRKHLLLRSQALQLKVSNTVAYRCVWYWDTTFVF